MKGEALCKRKCGSGSDGTGHKEKNTCTAVVATIACCATTEARLRDARAMPRACRVKGLASCTSQKAYKTRQSRMARR